MLHEYNNTTILKLHMYDYQLSIRKNPKWPLVNFTSGLCTSGSHMIRTLLENQYKNDRLLAIRIDHLLPHQVKTQYLHFRLHAKYFLVPWKIPEEITR